MTAGLQPLQLMYRRLPFFLILLLSPSVAEVDFAHDVIPIIKEHCAKCHTDGTYKGSFSMDTREELLEPDRVVVPTNSAGSAFIRLLHEENPDDRMPQKADPLSAEKIAVLTRWIDEGAPWETGFTFRKSSWKAPVAPRKPEIPTTGTAHPLDRFIERYWADRKIDPASLINDTTFLRRVTLDLTGLLPSREETRAFVNSTEPNKREAWINTLLARDVDYTDHWMSFWNDLLRNDYSGTGYIDGGRSQITEWLYAALMANKPYDHFVKELISPVDGSGGFVKGIKWRGRVNASQREEVQFAQNISQVFLGENMKCASCHDSFINDWKLKDAYGLAAIIADEPLEIHRCDMPTGEMAQAAFLFPELGTIDPSAPREARLQRTAELMTSSGNGRLARTLVNRLWQRLMGRGLVEPVDIMGNRPWDEDALDYLASYFAENGYDIKKLLAHLTSSRVYQSQSVEPFQGPADEFVFRGPEAKRLTAESFIDAVWTITGQAPDKVDAKSTDQFERPRVRAALVNSNELMRALGRPNREQVVTTRPAELSTLQALELNNGQSFASMLDKGAERYLAYPEGEAAAIDWLYQSTLTRPPTAEERSTAKAILGESPTKESWADLLWTVLMLPEFQLVF